VLLGGGWVSGGAGYGSHGKATGPGNVLAPAT
jgi:hypothetical protein